MTPAQIKKAEQLLNKREEMLTLFDALASKRGRIIKVSGKPALSIESMTVSIETLEKWIKQVKTVAKKGII